MKPEWLKFPPVADIFDQAAAFAAEDCNSTLAEWHLALSLLRFRSVRTRFPEPESLQEELFEAAAAVSDLRSDGVSRAALPEPFRTRFFAEADRLRERDGAPLPSPRHFLEALCRTGSDRFRTTLQKYDRPHTPALPPPRRRGRPAEELKRSLAGQHVPFQPRYRRLEQQGSRRRRGGMRNVFLFSGPAGTGKTETAREFARQLAVPLVRFDLAAYPGSDGVARLLGLVPGTSPGRESGLLITAVRETPRCVLLLHRTESAQPAIRRELIRLLERGSLTDRFGREADFREVCLILEENRSADSAGRTRLPEQFLSRLTGAVQFAPSPAGKDSLIHEKRSIRP